jgi:tetratricopeptide (TPR) repeat protein
MEKTPRRVREGRGHRSAAGPERAGKAAPVGSRLPLLLIAAAAVVAITLAAYAAAPGHAFVEWDDGLYVKENPLVLGKHYGALLTAAVAGNYHPLTMLSLAWNVSAPLSARPFIATNIALHLLNVLLVFWLVWWLSRRRLLVATFVALLFGIHPMHVESVAWVSERKDVLYTFFFLAGLIAYWRYLERSTWPRLALVFASFVLSCLAKGMAVVFPVMMVLLDYWKGRRVLERRAVLEKLPFLAVSLLFGLIALDVQGGGTFHGAFSVVGKSIDALTVPHALSVLQRLILPTHGYLTYVWKLFVPVGLCALNPYPFPEEMARPEYIVAPLFFLAMLALALWDVRRTRVLAFGLGWFLATVLLVLQWVPVGGAITADRYAYLSYVGLFFILGMALQAAIERNRALGVALWSAGGLFAVFLFFQTVQQVAMWTDSEALWTRSLQLHPDLAYAHVYRGKHRALTGHIPAALEDFQAARRLGLHTADVYEGLGTTYGSLGRLDSALVMLDRALRIAPRRSGLYYNRAVTYQGLGRPREALADLDRALALATDGAPRLHGARAYVMERLADYHGAVAEFDRAIAGGAGDARLWYSRGHCRLRLGDRSGAVEDFREALRFDPGHAQARAELRTLGLDPGR